MFKCLFKGHEMTEVHIDKTIYDYRGLRFWKCKRCSFEITSGSETNYEGKTLKWGGRNKK